MKRFVAVACGLCLMFGLLLVSVLPVGARETMVDAPPVTPLSTPTESPTEPETTDELAYFISLYKKAGGCGSVIGSATLVSMSVLAVVAYAMRKKTVDRNTEI